MYAIPLSFRFSLDFVYFPSILVLSRERRARKGITYMKKLIAIVLALIIALFTVPNRSANQPHVTAVNSPQTAITTTVEQVPEESEKPAETAFVSEVTEVETKVEVPKEEAIVRFIKSKLGLYLVRAFSHPSGLINSISMPRTPYCFCRSGE